MNTLLLFMPIIILVVFLIIPGGFLILRDAFKDDVEDEKHIKVKPHSHKAR